MEGIEGASPDGTVAGLFTPEPNSAALVFLRRLIGCTFDKIWTPGGGAGGGGSCNDVNDVLAQLVAVINWGMLAVIAVVATYLIFASLKDTANDGELGGRSMNPSWTLVMAALAAILCFPAFNGFSALQIGTMQVAVWSTGFGDSAWRVASDKMANANSVNASFQSMRTDGLFYAEPSSEAALRQQLAVALQARVEGELCARLLAKGVQNMATTGDTSITSTMSPEQDTYGSQYGSRIVQRTLYYKGGAALNESAGMCGSVTVSYIGKAFDESVGGLSGITVPGNAAGQAEIAKTAAEYRVKAASATAQTFLAQIDSQAKTLANSLFDASSTGPRAWGPAQVQQIAQAVNTVIGNTKKAGEDQLKNAPQALRESAAKAMTGQHDNGWFFAILYQRILVNATTVLSDLGNGGFRVASVPVERDFPAAWGCRSMFTWATGRFNCSDELQTYFREYSTELAALDQLKPAFTNAGAGTIGIGTNTSGMGAVEGGDPGMLARWVNNVLRSLVRANEQSGEGWSDPIPQMQATGNEMLMYGTGVLAIAGAGGVAANLPNPVTALLGELASMVAPLGWGLVAIGFVLSVVVPFMPLVYFFLAALSWLTLVVQTIITAPFWLMQMFYANRSGGIGSTSLARALTVLLAVLIRPALIIVGLVFCMYLMRVGLDYLNILTFNALSVLGASTSSLSSSIGNVAMAFGGFMIYLSMCVTLVAICCSLIDGVGDWVMEQVERGASHVFGSDAKHRTEGILGNPAAIAAAGIALRSRGSLAGTAGRLTDKTQKAIAARKSLSRK
ncbi:MAG: DotA/TraY family protein [Rhizobiaceae bacterium]|nr:DotA/TraY family protein [Rhizobiaceae bacterium]